MNVKNGEEREEDSATLTAGREKDSATLTASVTFATLNLPRFMGWQSDAAGRLGSQWCFKTMKKPGDSVPCHQALFSSDACRPRDASRTAGDLT
jgi:hypothetical protein